jgi:hypothetical protein
VHQAARGERGLSSFRVAELHETAENAPLQIEFLSIGADFDLVQIEPGSIADTKRQGQPVGEVDQVFIFNDMTVDFGGQAVVASGKISAGVVGVIGFGILDCPARCEMTIAQGAKCFAQQNFSVQQNQQIISM